MSELATEGTDELDVNTDVGFEASLARKLGVEVSPEQQARTAAEDTSISSGLTTEEESAPPEQPRDEQGRFAPVAQPDEETEEGAAPEGEQEDPWATVPDPLREEYQRIQRERDEAQSLIGRQGNEVGELRQQLARLEGMVQAQQTPQVQAAPLTDEVLDSWVTEYGGFKAVEAVINDGHDDRTVERAFATWGEYEPYKAAAARDDYFRALQSTTAEQQQAPGLDPRLEPVVREQEARNVTALITQAAGDRAPVLKEHIGAVLEDANVPQNLKEDLFDPQRAAGAAQTIIAYAELRAVQTATEQARQRSQEQAREAKLGARVASGSLRPAPQRQPSEGTDDRAERIARFKQMFRETPTTSVHDNIVKGS